MPWSSNAHLPRDGEPRGRRAGRGVQAAPRRAPAVGLPRRAVPARGRGVRGVGRPRAGAWCRRPCCARTRRSGPGSLQRFVDADFAQHYFTLLEDECWHDELRRMAAFDLVVNNADRKGGHCLLAEGRVWGIDNGLCFHVQSEAAHRHLGLRRDRDPRRAARPTSSAWPPIRRAASRPAESRRGGRRCPPRGGGGAMATFPDPDPDSGPTPGRWLWVGVRPVGAGPTHGAEDPVGVGVGERPGRGRGGPRTAWNSSQRGYRRRRVAAVWKCSLPQCGRPPTSPTMRSTPRKYCSYGWPWNTWHGDEARVRPVPHRQRDVVGRGDADLDREPDVEPARDETGRTSVERPRPRARAGSRTPSRRTAPAGGW